MRISDWSSDVCSSDLIDVGTGDNLPVNHGGGATHVGIIIAEHLHIVGDDDFALRSRLGVCGRGGKASGEDGHSAEGMECPLDELAAIDCLHRYLDPVLDRNSEEHTSELQSIMRIQY